jgi:hypothetical protein
VRISLRPPKGQLPAKILATQAKGVRAAAAAVAAVAAMRAATTDKLLGAMTVLRRWTSWIRCFIRTLHTLKAVCIFCRFTYLF